MMQWTMPSATFLLQIQKLASFYNEVGRLIISTNGTIISLREKTTFAENNSWGRRVQCGL